MSLFVFAEWLFKLANSFSDIQKSGGEIHKLLGNVNRSGGEIHRSFGEFDNWPGDLAKGRGKFAGALGNLPQPRSGVAALGEEFKKCRCVNGGGFF